MKYKIKTKAEDIQDAVIQKSGVKVEFTMREVEYVQNKNKKDKEAIEAQLKLENAKMANVLHHNPFLNEMSEEHMNATHMYYEALQKSRICEIKIKEFTDHEEELAKELNAIRTQIPELASKVENL